MDTIAALFNLHGSYWQVFLVLVLFLSLRYGTIAGVLLWWFYAFRRNQWAARKIQAAYPARADYLRELRYSLLTFVIFAAIATIPFLPEIRPYTQLGKGFAAGFAAEGALPQGWAQAYWFVSVLLMLALHDVYFYWMHRIVHGKRLYARVHKVHHLSHNPTPLAAFAFHPFEALTEFAIFPVVVFLIPCELSSIATWLVVMTLYNAYGHLGFELYPKNFSTHWLGRWVNTAVAHNMHHKFAKQNYGLYTLVWDRLFGTVDKRYDQYFATAKTVRVDGEASEII
jgi:Delta7-sterol 5-desaturase